MTELLFRLQSMPDSTCDRINAIAARSRTGFTMIELLVVIGIIGIVVGIVVTVVPRVKRSAYAAQTAAQMASISSAIHQYYNDYKAYPGPLSNNQLGSAYAPPGSLQQVPLIQYQGRNHLLGIYPKANMGIALSSSSQLHITGSQNLVLGLLGGLEFTTYLGQWTFYYNTDDIFPEGRTPDPVGPACLDPDHLHPQLSYMRIKKGDISVPSMAAPNIADFFHNKGTGGHSFADAAGRTPADAPIPVFLDKYPDAMPIHYMRTNIGGQAIAGVRNLDGVNGNLLIDPRNPNVVESPQYDLAQILDYTKSSIGVISSSRQNYHGLQGLGNAKLTDTIQSGYDNAGNNALAYLRDPSCKIDPNNPANSYDPSASNTHAGMARGKDGFILFSAGPDRLYGTGDDIVAPGGLQPGQ